MPARAAPSQGLDLYFHMLYPPNAVTDLHAAAVGSLTGDIQLQWTAPGNQNGTAINHYLVRFATFPAANVGAAESWWSGLAASERTIGSPHAPGVVEFTTLSGFTVGTTVYFGIKSVDDESQISAVDLRVGTAQQAQSPPLDIGPGAPPTPTGFAGIALTTGSVQWSWNTTLMAGFYTLDAVPSGTQTVQTTALTAVEGGFAPNTAVSRTLKAGNVSGLSGPTSAVTVFTLAAAPSTPTVTAVDSTHVQFSWSALGNPAGTTYKVERSLDGTTFNPIGTAVATSFNDASVSDGTTYYYRVAGVNGDGIASGPGGVRTVVAHQTDFLPPEEPLGLKGTVDASRQAFTLIWEPVTRNADGTTANDVVGYHIYRRTSIDGPPVRLTTTPISITAFADRINGGLYYYTVRAVDRAGNLSAESLFADSSPQANVIFVGPDGESSVTMPSEVNNLLRPAFNKYGVALTLDFVETPVPNDEAIVRDVQLRLIRGDTRLPVDDLGFTVPNATIAIGYASVNGEIVRGSPLSLRSAAMSGVTPQSLSLFWNNGETFVKVGGANDDANHTLSLRTSYLGEYQLRIAAASTVLNLDRSNVYPRIITPNGDGLNDRVYFVLENPNNATVTGEIFDKDGRSVATLPDPSLTGGIGTTMVWDGRDRDGNVVPGGVYIYRIEGEGRKFTGTVGVAK